MELERIFFLSSVIPAKCSKWPCCHRNSKA